MAPGLLGPPELQSSIHPTTVDHQSSIKSQPSITPKNQTKTPTFLSTGNPCLDFFHVAPETPPEEVIERLQFAYQNNPMQTLKLICNLRGVKGTGKNDKEGFYASALWLHENHPKTLAYNVGPIALFGSLKDLLEILFRVLEGLEVRKDMKEAWEIEKPTFFANRWTKKKASGDDAKKAKAVRAAKKAAKAKKAVERYSHDPEYKVLYDCVCEVFASLLREDIKLLQDEKDVGNISLAAKWCPSPDSSYDQSLLICESIAKRVFPREEYGEYEGVEEAHYAYRVRTRLRKEVLVPLRKALELPEVYMCGKRWRDIPYNRVSALAMHLRKKVFLKRDSNGFEEYIDEVKDGVETIAAGALLPHEIISGVGQGSAKLDEIAELQWKRMVDDLAKQGKLINCTAVGYELDYSCVALMLLVSELTGEPWKGKLLAGGEDPELYTIEGDKLESKRESILYKILVNCSFHLQEAIDKVLKFAVDENLGEDQMIRRLFVFTREEVESLAHTWEAEYAEIQRKFLEKGYLRVPEVVIWNLNNSLAVPVKCDQPGLAIVSGFSKNMLALFFEELGVLTPETVMNAAISRAEYDNLVVHD